MTLPDERPRASVGNLVARFEKKVVPDAAGSTPSPRPLAVSGGFSSYNGTPPSWMKKKDAVSPPSGSDNAATSASRAPAVLPEPPALLTSEDDPFTAPMPEPAPAPEPTPVIEPLVVPEPEAGPSSDQPMPPAKANSVSNSPAKPKAAPSTSKPIPSDSPKRSMITQMIKSTKVPPAPRINAVNKTTNVPSSSSVSSLNKAKSTSSLKSASTSSTRFTAPTAASKARAAADAAAIPAPLKPQNTGTSTTSTSRRAVVTPSSSKTVPFPARSPSSAPKPRAALFAPTASSLAKSRDVEDPMIRKPNAPPSSYSPRPIGRPRSGSTGSGSATPLKPLHLPTKSSASASGSTRRMVSVPRQPKAQHVKEMSQEELPQSSTIDDQVGLQDSAPQPKEYSYNLSDAPETTDYRPTDDLPQGTEEQSSRYVASVGPEVEEHSETLDQHSGYANGNSKRDTEASDATFVERQTTYDEEIQDTQEQETEIPDISSDA